MFFNLRCEFLSFHIQLIQIDKQRFCGFFCFVFFVVVVVAVVVVISCFLALYQISASFC